MKYYSFSRLYIRNFVETNDSKVEILRNFHKSYKIGSNFQLQTIQNRATLIPRFPYAI